MRLYLFLFLAFYQFAAGQEPTPTNGQKKDSISLLQALEILEVAHNIKFSYNPKRIPEGSITLNLDGRSLTQALVLLSNSFRIDFEKIDDRYYTLKKKTQGIVVCGYLRNGEDGTPIQGANILNKSTKKGVVSDTEGYFTLEENNINDLISISFLGFEPLVRPISELGSVQCDTLTLEPLSYALDEVLVQEYLGVGILKVKDGAIKIDPKNLEILSGLSEPDILQNIQLLPGIESPGETATGLFIRGGSPDQNLILWDGIKMYNSNHFFGMISAFNPYITEEVSVFRSGTDPQFGDRISGVIDIQTRNTVPDKLEGEMGINTLHADANLKIPLSKNLGLVVSGRRSLIDLFRSPTLNAFTQKVFQNTSIDEPLGNFDLSFAEEEAFFNFYDWSLKAISKLSEKDKLTVSTLHTGNGLDYTLQPNGSENVSQDQLNIFNRGASALWSRFWGPDLKSKVTTYYSYHKFDYEGQNPFLSQELNVSKDNTIKEFGLSTHVDWTMNDLFTLSGGYQFFSNQVSYTLAYNDFNTTDDTTGRTHGLYAHLKYEKEDQWNIGVGIRSNYYSSLNQNFIEPRINLERIINSKLRLRASAELRNQAVSQIVEFFTQDFGLENQVWALATEDGIPLLRSDQLSLGLLYTLSDTWHIDIDAYYKNIDGFSTYTRGFESFQEDLSEGNSLIKGIDVLLKKKIGDYTSWLGYTYATNKFLFEGLNQGRRFRGNNDIRHSLTWSHFYKWRKFQFSLGWKYRSGIPYSEAIGTSTTDENITIDYDAPNSKNLPNYHRLDFSVLYDFRLSKKPESSQAKLGFSLLNVYGRENILNRNFGLFEETDMEGNVQNISLGTIDKYSLGVTPILFFRWMF